MKKTLVGLFAGTTALLTIFGFATQAKAIILNLEFNNAGFQDGADLSGGFSYDTVTETYSNFNIFAEGGTGTDINNSFTYTTSNSQTPSDGAQNSNFGSSLGAQSNSDTQFSLNAFDDFGTNEIDRDIVFTFDQSLNTLSSPGDTVDVVNSNSIEFSSRTGDGTQLRVPNANLALQVTQVTGIETTAVPFEIESGIGFALLGLGAAWKFRKKAKATIEA